MFHQGKDDDAFALTYANILWGSLCPLVIWRVLKADTEYWRGLGRRAVALQSLFRQKHRMDERISSRGLHVLIEMHRKFIIDFAYLEIKRKIGVGSSAVVFNGVLHSKTPVAIKVYTPVELTDDVVAEFSHEAALCGALHHPNVVKFYGMCVCPPTICLVSELCQGNLDDVTRAIARRAHDMTRQQLLINLHYMIDATRAVAYLHSFSPAFLHRDIKPSNFLVDRHGVVKLTDFGESRSLPRACGGAGAAGNNGSQSSRGAASRSTLLRPSEDAASTTGRNAMTVRGTAEYMAPELIQGKAGTALYGEAADIYSLAMTLWDVLYPLGDKFPDANGNHLKVYEAVLCGQRPALGDELPDALRELLLSSWSDRPELRPSAFAVLQTLERLQHDVSQDVALAVINALEKQIVLSSGSGVNTLSGTVDNVPHTGERIVQQLLSFDFVNSVDEAVRVGNGFMTAGQLHHVRHLVGFENSSELYMFDASLRDGDPVSGTHWNLARIDETDCSRDSRAMTGDSAVEGDGDGAATTVEIEPQDDRDVLSSSQVNGRAPSHSDAVLVRFPARRKPSSSRHGSDADASQSQLQAQPHRLSVTSSQWANTTANDPSTCPCRKLGAGMRYLSKSTRFRRGRRKERPRSAQSQDAAALVGGGSLTSSMHATAASSTSVSTTKDTARTALDEKNNGLTARLLMNEFSNTGDSAYSGPFGSPHADDALLEDELDVDIVVHHQLDGEAIEDEIVAPPLRRR
ncbi:hypothetical protein PINS_up001340 [Pythium insidiosum]|nr:hypothetical protein PINS_up001340 [Pythium insidiosum]